MNAPATAAAVAKAGDGTLPKYERRIAIGELLDTLVLDGHIDLASADKLRAEWRLKKIEHHPIVIIGDQKWRSAKSGKLMSGDWLAEWLAAKAGLDYFHIDPLKIDFTRVGETMSITYAQRFSILPIERTPRNWWSPPPSRFSPNG